MDAVAGIIANSGYIKMLESQGRLSFNCGYTEHGFDEKVYFKRAWFSFWQYASEVVSDIHK